MTFAKHFIALTGISIIIGLASIGIVFAQDPQQNEETLQQKIDKMNRLETTIETLHEKLFDAESQVQDRGWKEEQDQLKILLEEFRKVNDDLRKKIHIERAKGTIGRASVAPTERAKDESSIKVPQLTEDQELEVMYFIKTRYPARYVEMLQLYSKANEQKEQR